MARFLVLASTLAVLVHTAGCASTGGFSLGVDRSTCIIATGVLGGITGAVIGHNNNTKDEGAGAAIGGVTGAALGALVCGEGGQVALPTAQIRATPRAGDAPLRVGLQAEVPPDPRITKYEWDFGDGQTATGPNVSHTYSQADAYNVRLTVTDAKGRTGTASTRIDARAPAPVEPPVSAAPPPPVKRKIVLRGINFPFNSAQISPGEAQVLDVARETLGENRDVRVRIEGHADSSGPDAYNMMLSEKRAQAVRGYLTKKGVEGSRLEAVGKGETEPVASNDTRDGRAQNRRVELDILE